MSYNINDRKSAVLQIQKYMRAISTVDKRITAVYEDGIFDEITAKAVGEFQAIYDLPSTGAVDKDTFEMMYSVYCDIVRMKTPCEKINAFGCKYENDCISIGQEFDSIYILQVMLSMLSEHYGFDDVDINGKYDDKTENAVREFQRIHGLEETGNANRQTREELTFAYNKHIREDM